MQQDERGCAGAVAHWEKPAFQMPTPATALHQSIHFPFQKHTAIRGVSKNTSNTCNRPIRRQLDVFTGSYC